MSIVRIVTRVRAPIERCFDLSRSIEFHIHSMPAGEAAIGGVTSGLIEMGQEVTWSARHFGVRQTLTSRITAFDRPNHFRDTMLEGAFRSFDHDHIFRRAQGVTVMEDVFAFASPFGMLGGIFDALVLKRYMRRLLTNRAIEIKRGAESDAWKAFLPL